MSILKKLYKLGEAELNALTEKIQDPLKMIEMGIKDLKSDFDKNLRTLAQAKVMKIKLQKDVEEYTKRNSEIDQELIEILAKSQSNQTSSENVDKTAKNLLLEKESITIKIHKTKTGLMTIENDIVNIENELAKQKILIEKYEKEVQRMKDVKVKKVSKKNDYNFNIADSSETIEMMERMKNKVLKDEILSDAYSEFIDDDDEFEDDFDKESKINEALKDLKNKIKNK